MALTSLQSYFEVSSPQYLDDSWHELNFDLTADHSVLQDVVAPETGTGYVYRDAKLVGSATHNRFIFWRSTNDILELVEMSPDIVLEGNQVRIKFTNSPVVDTVDVIEFSDYIIVMIATVSSVHRLQLPHPKTTNKSVLNELNNDVLFNPANYYILNNQGSLNAQQPICATSWHDNGVMKCSLSFPDSSLLIVKFGRHSVSSYDIKQVGIIGRLWSRMPALLAKHPNDCANAVFISKAYFLEATGDTLLFTLCRDYKIRIFSTNDKDCVCTHNMIRQADFSQSIASTTMTATAELPMMKMLNSQLIVYLIENEPQFVVVNYTYQDGVHSLTETKTISAPRWAKLVDFSVTDHKIWALANDSETESSLLYLDRSNLLDVSSNDDSEEEGDWVVVNLFDDLNASNVRNLIAEIFWRNHFSASSIEKAITGLLGEPVPGGKSLEALEVFLRSRFVDQDEAWSRLYDYCLETHHSTFRNIGLLVSPDETIISVIKRDSLSFVCPLNCISEDGPVRLIEDSPRLGKIVESLNYISTQVMNDELANAFEDGLYGAPAQISDCLDDIVDSLVKSKRIELSSDIFFDKNSIITAIDYISDKLDMTTQSNEFIHHVLEEYPHRMRSELSNLCSNSGILVTYELFRKTAQSRLILTRDLLIYIFAMNKLSDIKKKTSSEKHYHDTCEELFTTGRVARLIDIVRSYGILFYVSEAHISSRGNQVNPEIIKFISERFEFFKESQTISNDPSSLDTLINRNLLMSFLARGGTLFSSYSSSPPTSKQALSSTFYASTIVHNLFKLLWPKSNHHCIQEFMLVHQLDEHLARYLNLTEDWLGDSESDLQFLKASNNLLQGRAEDSVRIFNLLLMNIYPNSLVGRFMGFDEEPADSLVGANPTIIYRYYEKLIQLFQIYGDNRCLVLLINHCMSLLDSGTDQDQQHWLNCFRAKLFQFYLELDESDEAYHTMILTTDQSLRFNCLRKFVVHHCEKEQWISLLSYPYIGIKGDFIKILNQKAETSDLLKLNENRFRPPTYYDLLFSYHVCDEDYKLAAEIMYNYALRLAYEVPGTVSVKKQSDTLLIALNALRVLDDPEAFVQAGTSCSNGESRSGVLKRSRDSENFSGAKEVSDPASLSHRATCRDIKLRYELTQARVKLLERDQTGNAIALSPLKPDEIIGQLVASSMFQSAIDLALLFKASMNPILEGLTAKYISIMRLSTVDTAINHDLERELSAIFSDSYSNIDTYNYIANSTTSLVEKLWRLIDYYLTLYDGVSHTYSGERYLKGNTTVLMRIVAEKLLSVGYCVPASLKRMYMTRYTPELLKLFIKYDELTEAADLAVEMIDKLTDPTNIILNNKQPPVYLPTHLIRLLLQYLNEDATNMSHIKTSEVLMDRLHKFKRFIEST